MNQEAEKLSRILDLSGSDPAFYVLATHSFIESWMRARFDIEYNREYSFPDMLYMLRADIEKSADRYLPDLNVLSRIKASREPVNNVRHRFAAMKKCEAEAATHMLVRFCRLVGCQADGLLEKLEQTMDLWKRSGNRMTDICELNQKGFQLVMEQQQTRKLRREVQELTDSSRTARQLKQQISALEDQLAGMEKKAGEKDSACDRLRREKWELEQQLRKNSDKLNQLESAACYIDELRRISVYTRTRMDYEQSITRLTHEQQKVLDQIKLDHDFLIKGGAGTGKTLVLLQAMQAALQDRHSELKFETQERKIVLLTYNKTLARYNTYITKLLFSNENSLHVHTAESFLTGCFNEHFEGEMNFSIISNYCSDINLDFIRDYELASEIDDFIFSGLISRKEYVDEMCPRKGRKPRLSAGQRRQVWECLEQVKDHMEAQKQYSRNYVSYKMNLELDSAGAGQSSKACEYIFIDEVQDLTTADLKILQRYSNRCLLMAGDTDQALYQSGFPFSRAGINIKGHTSILHTSFRNTVQTHELAEKYRVADQPAGYDPETAPESFRNGPLPELFRAGDSSALIDLLCSRADFMIEQLGYEQENICIAAPDKRDFAKFAERLGNKGYKTGIIMDDEFSFSETNVIRLTTMHSAKGLDFPVVLLYLPRLPFMPGGRDVEYKSKIYRNLIYVAITRAMDMVNVFILDRKDKPNPPEIETLEKCMENYSDH